MGARNHPAGSDVINWGEVMEGKRAVPSPFVSTTADLSTARRFSNEGPSPGHVVARFTTRRTPIGPTPGFEEGDYLFFLLLGEPGETLEEVP